MKKRTKEEEIEKGEYGPPAQKLQGLHGWGGAKLLNWQCCHD